MNAISNPHSDTEPLRQALVEVGRLTRQGCNEVSSLAQMALVWLETPAGCRDLEVVASALLAIRDAVQRLEDFVDDETGGACCGYDDPDRLRRLAACSAALKG
ncbi:hypothetical protein ACUTR7_07295 [Delftia sp. NA_296.1]|jgi:hypothetical protein|uniref:hypothetical protein n=1 Tax=Delftia sp. NA_296.1 TaxID=3415648 RepID=UPI0040456433